MPKGGGRLNLSLYKLCINVHRFMFIFACLYLLCAYVEEHISFGKCRKCWPQTSFKVFMLNLKDGERSSYIHRVAGMKISSSLLSIRRDPHDKRHECKIIWHAGMNIVQLRAVFQIQLFDILAPMEFKNIY